LKVRKKKKKKMEEDEKDGRNTERLTSRRGIFREDFDPILLLGGGGSKHLEGLLRRGQLEPVLDF